MSEREPHWWSWADILRNADRLGIPSFQRGAVWDSGNTIALLESIYEQSPCGSFVFWEPDDEKGNPGRRGVPLCGFDPDKSPLWLVDGQQRSRAMLETYRQLVVMPSRDDGWSLVRSRDLDCLTDLGRAVAGGADDESDADEDGDDGDGDLRPWVVVLAAMPVFDRGGAPYFGKHSESRNIRRGSMFRRLRPRARTRLNEKGKRIPAPPLPIGTIPLASLVSSEGVFHVGKLRKAARKALKTFQADEADTSGLDDLLPWGPQFVTGHAYEIPGHGSVPATPMSWIHLHERRAELGVHEMVGRLEGLFARKWVGVIDGFKGMLDGNRFAVGWLPPSDVSSAIDAYVRINRAGIRVRAEERALALLSRAHPEMLDELAGYIAARDGAGQGDDQRALLAHESDRHMGFSVWMTVVTRYTALALLGDYARRWLGVSSIDKQTFGYRLDRVGPHETEAGYRTWARPDYSTPRDVIRESCERATPALLLIDAALSKDLLLDHRMARPRARALYPLLDLLYRVPAAELDKLRRDTGFRVAISRLLHWSLLAPYFDKPEMEQLIVDVHDIDEDEARKDSAPVSPWDATGEQLHTLLRAALWRYQKFLLATWHAKHRVRAKQQKRKPVRVAGVSVSRALTALALDAFKSEVHDARSLQHPMVGWLYALERIGGATEFSWLAQHEGYQQHEGKIGVPWRKKDLPAEEELRRHKGRGMDDLYPEKQHIVPFAHATRIVNKGGTRATASPSNAIGNLTWLSRRQNGLDALADRWTAMDPARDEKNLRARGMLANTTVDGEERRVLGVYEELSGLVHAPDFDWRDEHARASALRLYDAFCAGRTEWMVERMQKWLTEPLPAKATRWLRA